MAEWTKIWIGLGITIWILGFLNAGKTQKRTLPFERSFVRPPYLIYLLCGLPKSPNNPKGVVSVKSVMVQLTGLLWILFGLVSPALSYINLLVQGVVLNLCMLFIILYGWMLYRRNLYKID